MLKIILNSLLTFTIIFTFSSCHKRELNSSLNNEKAMELSRQLEDYNSYTDKKGVSEVVAGANAGRSTYSTPEGVLKNLPQSGNKKSFKQRVLAPILIKKINKTILSDSKKIKNNTETSENAGSISFNQNIKIGLILALIGVLLIVLGTLPYLWIFGLIGILTFIVGLVFIIFGLVEQM